MTSLTARPLPRGLAALVAELELLAPETVNRDSVSSALLSAGQTGPISPERVNAVIDQLRRAGWLLPLRTRGVWEFAPASRSGAFSSGDPFLELRAALQTRPDLAAAIAMESAAFRRGLAQHPPTRETVSVPKGTQPSGALATYRLVRLALPPAASTDLDGLPTHTVAGLLAAMAIKPAGYHDWPNVNHWLVDAASRLTATQVDPVAGGVDGHGGLITLLAESTKATWARAAYLLRMGDQRDAAQHVLDHSPGRPTGPVYMGPRDRDARYDHATGVYDSILARP